MTLIGCVARLLAVVAFVFLCLACLPGIGPDAKYEPYKIPRPPPLEGVFARNTKLNEAECILDYQINGPESIEVRGDDLYTALIGGWLVKITLDGKVEKLMRLAPDDVDSRVIGMRFLPDGSLMGVDHYRGVFKVHLNNKTYEQMFSVPDTYIPNDLDVAKDGTIYWSSVTTKFGYENIVPYEFLGEATGGLFKFDPKTKQNTPLIQNLRFGNGVQLSPNEDFVIISEFGANRIHRYYLKGPKKGQSDIFVDNLPGGPDNIRPNGKGGYLVGFFIVRKQDGFDLLDFLSDKPLLRKVTSRTIYLTTKGWELFKQVAPTTLSEVIHSTFVGDDFNMGDPSMSMVVELDADGKVISTLQGNDGRLKGISQVSLHPKYYIFASAVKTCIWKLKR